MAVKTEEKVELPAIRHEAWCRPTDGRDEVRIEQYVLYRDAPDSNRSVPNVRATRCVECAETHYEAL